MPRPSRLQRTTIFFAAALAVLAACGDRSGKVLVDPVFPPPATTIAVTTLPPGTLPPEPTAAAALTLVAPWIDGTPLPQRYTCADVGVSPALTWSNVPPGTVELALSVVDLDADEFVHWLVYAISPIEPGFAEGQPPDASFEWQNSADQAAWFSPCPPTGEEHRYSFTVYALNQQLEAADDASANEVLSILEATTIAQSSVTGTVME